MGSGSSPLFAGLSRAEIKLIVDRGSIRSYPARSWLYREGERATELFVLCGGLVRQSQVTPAGNDVLVRFVMPGDVLGYFALSPAAVTQASSQAVRPSQVLVWDRDTALDVFQSVPLAAVNLFNIAVADAVYLHSRTQRLLTEPVAKRVAWALSELARVVGIRTPKGVEIGAGAGQRELADLAGTTIFTVSRELTKLERRGLLSKRRGRILVFDYAKIQDA